VNRGMLVAVIMVVALLVLVVAAGISGWFMTEEGSDLHGTIIWCQRCSS
jgi:hypothetical protein